MIAINGHPYVPPVDSFFILREYGGEETLQFDIHPKNPLYAQVAEEVPVVCNGQRYLIKAINERRTASTVTCALDLDEWKAVGHQLFSSVTQTLSALLNDLLLSDLPNSGWTHTGDELVSIRRTIELECCTAYDIVQKAADTYGVAFQWDTGERVLQVIKPDAIEPSGAYLTEELNLKDLCFKGSSSSFATRLYPYGKDGLDIVSVNDGLPYVEDHTYSDKIISAVWKDERYTVPENLRDDAIEKLREMAYPVRSYTCNVADLARASGQYEHLAMGLYSVVTLIDRERSSRVNHRVVSYKQYPLSPALNVVTLSSIPARISGSSVSVSISKSEERVSGRVNELRQDVETNSARIAETYSSGEVNALLENRITQSKDALQAEISETYADKESVNQVKSELELTIQGLEARTSKRGGSNLLRGTAFYDLDSWDVEPDSGVSCLRDHADLAQTESGGAALITGGSLSQAVRTVPGGQYCWKLRYRLTGAVQSTAVLTVADQDFPLGLSDGWTEISGNFTAGEPVTGLSLANAAGTLLAADLTLMPGLEVAYWDQAQDEILSDELYFANGKLGVGSSGSGLRTAITNSQFSVENTGTGERVIYAGVGGAQLDRTTVRKSMTVQAENNAAGAYCIIPLGNGHVLHTIGD